MDDVEDLPSSSSSGDAASKARHHPEVCDLRRQRVGEPGEEDGGRRVGAGREAEGDERVRAVVVLRGVAHAAVVLKQE